MKYCKDCKHFTRMSERAMLHSGGEFCARPVWIKDVVKGEILRGPVSAREERTTKPSLALHTYDRPIPVFCGIDAQYFEDKGGDE